MNFTSGIFSSKTLVSIFLKSWIRVIDPCGQMKREYNTILDDADSANRNNFVPSQLELYMMLSGNFSQGDQ